MNDLAGDNKCRINIFIFIDKKKKIFSSKKIMQTTTEECQFNYLLSESEFSDVIGSVF